MGPPASFAAAPYAAAMGAPRTLYVYFDGVRHLVDKDRWVIGRGKRTSDLTVADPNVSRQHALVEVVDGRHFMVDLGSTNGIELHGERVARRAIEDGDVYVFCGHEIRFVFG